MRKKHNLTSTIIFGLLIFGLIQQTVEAHTSTNSAHRIAQQQTPEPIITPTPPARDPAAFYVSKNGDNSNGESWNGAWNELDQINWSAVVPGDIIYIDGGPLSRSMTYTSTLQPAASGTDSNPITIQLSNEVERSGQAIFFGGNGLPLPECGQAIWDPSQWEKAGSEAIRFNAGISNIIVDGTKRSGITIHGWNRFGIVFDPDRVDDGVDSNSSNITLRFLEIYNNGAVVQEDDLDNLTQEAESNSSGLFYPVSGSPGIKLSGSGHTFEFLEIHDNAADAIQSNFTNPAGGVFNNIDDITILHSWFYNQRPHSGQDNSPSTEVCTAEDTSGCDEGGAPNMDATYFNYPAEPTNRQESFNWCTHNDGVQIFSANDLNKMTIESSIMGPNLQNALILGDRGNENTTAWVNDLTLRNVIITRFSNNALGMNGERPNVGQNWLLDQVTIYGHYNKQNMGSLSLQSNANQNEHFILNTLQVFGRAEFEDGNVQFDNNCEFNLYTGSINGRPADPQFESLTTINDIFEPDLSIDFSTVFLDDYIVTNSECGTAGSQLTSVADLMTIFNQNATAPEPPPATELEVIENTEAVLEIGEDVSEINSDGEALQEEMPAEEIALVDNNHSNNDQVDQETATNSVEEIVQPVGLDASEILLIGLGLTAMLIFIILVVLIVAAWRLYKQEQLTQ
ncbi:MAG: hypothetical protein AAF902_02285 [Chloroflexota bacterium]